MRFWVGVPTQTHTNRNLAYTTLQGYNRRTAMRMSLMLMIFKNHNNHNNLQGFTRKTSSKLQAPTLNIQYSIFTALAGIGGDWTGCTSWQIGPDLVRDAMTDSYASKTEQWYTISSRLSPFGGYLTSDTVSKFTSIWECSKRRMLHRGLFLESADAAELYHCLVPSGMWSDSSPSSSTELFPSASVRDGLANNLKVSN
jgi:hypothetical protein